MTDAEATESGQIPLLRPTKELLGIKLSKKGLKAQRLVKRYSLMAGGLGVVPMTALVGQAAVAGLLLKLLNDLCRIYDVSFSDQQSKILIASILGGAHYHWISRYLTRFARSYFSLGRTPATMLLHPVISGVLVYYIGRLFLVHLESGVWHSALVSAR